MCRGRRPGKSINDRLPYVAQAAVALADLGSATRSASDLSLHRNRKPGNGIVNDDRGLVLVYISTLRLVEDGFDSAGFRTPQYTAPEALAAPPRHPRTTRPRRTPSVRSLPSA